MAARVSSKARSRSPRQEGFLARLLDPIDRLSEAIFSILILLTFTLAFRVIKFNYGTGPEIASDEVNQLLIAAVGCTLAWGIIDGVMYALTSLFERGEKHRLLRDLDAATSDEERIGIIADELDHILEPITLENKRHLLYQDVLENLRGSQPQPVGFKREDFEGAVGSVLVAILAVLPSITPFVLIRHDPYLALRVSNVISFLVLFYLGYSWGKYTGANPWRTGIMLAVVALLMMAIAIPLGG
jgi:hypothetical protein